MECARAVTSEFSINRRILDIGLTAAQTAMTRHAINYRARARKEQRRRTSSILYSLGRQITAAQAKHLDELSLSFPALCEIRASCTSDDEFQKTLMRRGVRSKKL